MKLNQISAESLKADLLGPNQPPHLVLFVNGDEELSYARTHLAEASSALPITVMDSQRDPELASWFGVACTPALAVVQEGVLLAIEYDCEAGLCARMLAAAEHRLHTLLAAEAI